MRHYRGKRSLVYTLVQIGKNSYLIISNNNKTKIKQLWEHFFIFSFLDKRFMELHSHICVTLFLFSHSFLYFFFVFFYFNVYFLMDYLVRCGPCRQFTPDLVNFYNRINSRKGREGQFEIVWISRCRDYESFAQYFTQMNWLAMQPEDAMGIRGQQLASRYKVKGIPSLVLLDEVGNVITLDARNKIPTDKAGIGFPWRNPIAQAYVNLLPKSIRLLIKTQFQEFKEQILTKVKLLLTTVQTVRAATAGAT